MKSFKTFISEAKTSGADFEVAIVLGWYEATGTPLKIEDTGISAKDIKTVQSNSSLREAGLKIAQKLIQLEPAIGRQKFAFHYGRGNPPVTSAWSKYGAGKQAASRTPKTDLYIGDYNISLKIGAAQLMSGAREEALATFYNALEQSESDISKDPVINECIEVIEKFTSGITNGTTAQVIKNKSDKAVVEADAVHKITMEKLRTLFETNEKFRLAFIREAMTGHIKFGKDSRASADYFLVADHSGSSVEFHSIDDDAYVKKVANASNISVKMKSTSVKSKSAKAGDRRWWSALGLVTKDLSTVTEEATTNMSSIDEGLGSTLRNALSAAKRKLQDVVSTAKTLVKRNLKGFLKFLGFDVDVTFQIRF